jgi:hypothetical protein
MEGELRGGSRRLRQEPRAKESRQVQHMGSGTRHEPGQGGRAFATLSKKRLSFGCRKREPLSVRAWVAASRGRP